MKMGSVHLVLLLAACAFGQKAEWVGLAQDVRGDWRLVGSNNELTERVKQFHPIRAGSRFKLAGTGVASGRLRIALSSRQSFEICCERGCREPRPDCGEAISLPSSTAESAGEFRRILAAVSRLLLSEPERYRLPAIGGRGPDDPVILLEDGIATASAPMPMSRFASRISPQNANELPQWIEVRGIDGEGRLGDPIAKPAPLHWEGTMAAGAVTLPAGLFQLSLLEGPAEGRVPTFSNAWILAVPSEQTTVLTGRYAAAARELKTVSDGVLLRAYLTILSSGVKANQ